MKKISCAIFDEFNFEKREKKVIYLFDTTMEKSVGKLNEIAIDNSDLVLVRSRNYIHLPEEIIRARSLNQILDGCRADEIWFSGEIKFKDVKRVLLPIVSYDFKKLRVY